MYFKLCTVKAMKQVTYRKKTDANNIRLSVEEHSTMGQICAAGFPIAALTLISDVIQAFLHKTAK
jgi:hypothetical protein